MPSCAQPLGMDEKLIQYRLKTQMTEWQSSCLCVRSRRSSSTACTEMTVQWRESKRPWPLPITQVLLNSPLTRVLPSERVAVASRWCMYNTTLHWSDTLSVVEGTAKQWRTHWLWGSFWWFWVKICCTPGEGIAYLLLNNWWRHRISLAA